MLAPTALKHQCGSTCAPSRQLILSNSLTGEGTGSGIQSHLLEQQETLWTEHETEAPGCGASALGLGPKEMRPRAWTDSCLLHLQIRRVRFQPRENSTAYPWASGGEGV